MGDLYKHKYTWLKVLAIAYPIEILLLFFLANMEVSLLGELSMYLMVFIGACIGMIIGAVINICTRFRKAVTGYVLGHLLFIGCIYGYVKWEQSQALPAAQIDNTDFLKYTPDVIGTLPKQAMEKVIYEMEGKYPLGAYELHDITTDYINGDTTGNNGLLCTIVFTLPEENHTKYISLYYVKKDSLSAIYEKKDTTTMEYKKFRKETLKLHKVVEELEH